MVIWKYFVSEKLILGIKGHLINTNMSELKPGWLEKQRERDWKPLKVFVVLQKHVKRLYELIIINEEILGKRRRI